MEVSGCHPLTSDLSPSISPSVSSLLSLSHHFSSCLFPLLLTLSFPFVSPSASPLSFFSISPLSLLLCLSFCIYCLFPSIFLYAVCLSHLISSPLSVPSFFTVISASCLYSSPLSLPPCLFPSVYSHLSLLCLLPLFSSSLPPLYI